MMGVSRPHPRVHAKVTSLLLLLLLLQLLFHCLMSVFGCAFVCTVSVCICLPKYLTVCTTLSVCVWFACDFICERAFVCYLDGCVCGSHQYVVSVCVCIRACVLRTLLRKLMREVGLVTTGTSLKRVCQLAH